MENEKTQTILKAAEDLLAPFGLPTHRPTDNRLDMLVQPAALVDIVQRIMETRWGYLSAITGLDHPGNVSRELGDRQWRQDQETSEDHERDGSIEIMYHFCKDAAVLTLHVWVSYTNPGVPTIANLIPPAVLYETELSEMFGVRVRNIPTNKEHLLLPDDWPQNVYPLRKSFTGLKETTKN